MLRGGSEAFERFVRQLGGVPGAALAEEAWPKARGQTPSVVTASGGRTGTAAKMCLG